MRTKLIVAVNKYFHFVDLIAIFRNGTKRFIFFVFLKKSFYYLKKKKKI